MCVVEAGHPLVVDVAILNGLLQGLGSSAVVSSGTEYPLGGQAMDLQHTQETARDRHMNGEREGGREKKTELY